jgi:hypothetical protein
VAGEVDEEAGAAVGEGGGELAGVVEGLQAGEGVGPCCRGKMWREK